MLFFSQNYFINFNNTLKIDSQINVYWYKYLFVHLFSTVGAHIGHTLKNTLRQASWMIYGYKWDLSIINLAFTVSSIKAGFTLVCGCSSKVRPFWFVTQDKSFYRYSRYLAIKCGEFSSTLYWIRGMASIIPRLILLILLENRVMFLCVKIFYLILILLIDFLQDYLDLEVC